jgi:hypothetical protein
MRHIILVHENGGSATAEVFAKRSEAKDAFRKIRSGTVSLYEVGSAQAMKRANYGVTHEDSEDSLDKMSEKQLRSEAKKRDLLISGNPTASRSQLISEIQQHELSQRLTHRCAFPDSYSSSSSSYSDKEDGYDEMTIEELKTIDADVDLTGCSVKQDSIDRHRAFEKLGVSNVSDLKAAAASEQVELPANARKSEIINAILAHRRAKG